MAVKPPWFDAQMLVGATLQGYHLESFLGEGGFGVVYRTADTREETRAAKVLFPPHSLGNEDMQVWASRSTNFLGEATTAASFRHRNIIKVFDTRQAYWYYQDPLEARQGHVDLSGAYPLQFYVAEYLPDGVDRRLRDGRLFSADEAINIGLQVCEALAALHSDDPQVLHRDLNPGNIRLAEGGRVVVTDFGVARTEGLPPAYVDREGPIVNRVVGAPEQFIGEEADVRTDIYQLGALLLVMLTGKPANENGADLLARRKDMPDWLTQTLQRCLQHDRSNRFQTVSDLKGALLSRSAPEAAWPGIPGGFNPPQPHSLWEFPLPSPNWRTINTPVAESPEGCYIWDRRTIHRLDPATGASIWSWTPDQGASQADIRDGPQSPAVQVGGDFLYIRQGNLLFCLRPSDDTRRWEYEHWSDIAGTYLLANGLIVLDSYRAASAGLLGPAALDAETGRLAWRLEEPQYHVTNMAATDEALVLVECRGIGGIGGVRVRLVDLSRGETLAVQDLSKPGESERAIPGEYASSVVPGRLVPVTSEFGLFRPRRPLIMADGTIVVWSNDGLSRRQDVFCFDSHLALRWTKSIQVEDTQPDLSLSGSNFLIGAGRNLLAFRAEYGDARRDQQGWVARFNLQTGELGQEKSLPLNDIPLSAAVAPDSSVVFVVVRQQEGDKKGSSLWRLMALKPDTGEMSYLEPGRELPGELSPLAPIATSSRLYLQVPLAQGPGLMAAFQWL